MTSPPVANLPAICSPASIATNKILKRNKKVLTGLAIAETVIGSLSIVISCIAVGYTHDPGNSLYSYSHYDYNNSFRLYYVRFARFNVGEGIWCGVWILANGALGIASGRKRPSPCLINCHMGFSMIGAIFAAGLLSISIVTATFNTTPMSIGLESVMATEGLAALILCIFSAVYCYKTISLAGLQNGCGTCCTDEVSVPLLGGQVEYAVQSPQSNQQGIVQTYPSGMTGQQAAYPVCYVTVMQPGVTASYQPGLIAQQPVHVNQQAAVQQSEQPLPKLLQNSNNKSRNQEAMGCSADGATNEAYEYAPPSYSLYE